MYLWYCLLLFSAFPNRYHLRQMSWGSKQTYYLRIKGDWIFSAFILFIFIFDNKFCVPKFATRNIWNENLISWYRKRNRSFSMTIKLAKMLQMLLMVTLDEIILIFPKWMSLPIVFLRMIFVFFLKIWLEIVKVKCVINLMATKKMKLLTLQIVPVDMCCWHTHSKPWRKKLTKQ